ncbi:MAG TPA: hypothetical protein VLK58_23215 [Conexibacter sp.]|nr:hypothetical protein [Conexibacter sp.]
MSTFISTAEQQLAEDRDAAAHTWPVDELLGLLNGIIDFADSTTITP